MSSRLALSALLILIGAMVLASQGSGLLKKIKVLQTSCANKIAETRSVLVLYDSCTRGTSRARRDRPRLAPRSPVPIFQTPRTVWVRTRGICNVSF